MTTAVPVITMLLIGLTTGISTGLTGASGVAIVVPLLTLFLSFSVHSAIGTSLIVDVVASLAVMVTYYKNGNIEIRSGIWVLIGSIAGAQLGALVATSIPETGLGIGFGIGMILMGIVIWRRSHTTKDEPTNDSNDRIEKPDLMQVVKALMIGLGIGLLTGIMGAGGGMMILFALIFILKFPLHRAIGTSTLIMAITALSGAAGYAMHGEVDILAGIVIGIGAIAGGVASAKLANTFSEQKLSQVAGGFFVIMGIIMTIILMNGNPIMA
jgi:uncharacterized membrane protein YfcA